MAAGKKYNLPTGTIFHNMLLNNPVENVLRLQNMELEHTDVVVASYPKTGTTLLQEIVWLIVNNVDLKTANEVLNFQRVPYMELGARDNFKVFEELPHPRILKTHVTYEFLPKTARAQKCKTLYIIRNPKDTMVSFYHFYRMHKIFGYFKGSWSDYFDYFIENNAMLSYGNPIDHMRGFWEHKNDANMFIAVYEDLVRYPRGNIREIAAFLEKELSDEDLDKIVDATSFRSMKANPMTNHTRVIAGEEPDMDLSISQFMRKGEVGDWKNYFTAEQNEVMDALCVERLEGCDLSFIYE